MKLKKFFILGDILISFGDFLENNAQLVPTGYVEEFWIEELEGKTQQNTQPNHEFLGQFLELENLHLDEALKISLDFQIPLTSSISFTFWDQISLRRIIRNFTTK